MVGSNATHIVKREPTMEAIIGRYRVRLEETGLVLTHPVGITFDLTPDETLGLWNFIKVYRQTLITMQRDTDPRLGRIATDEDHSREE
jgi:hypothetical protein